MDIPGALRDVQELGWAGAAEKHGLSRDALRGKIRRSGLKTGQMPSTRRNPAKQANTQPETRLILSDAHVPYHDRKAWSIALSVARDIGPERIILLGDFMDVLALSAHPKTKPDVVKFAEELHAGNRALDQLQAASPNSRIYYFEGNHEARATRYEAENGQLENLLSVEKNLNLAKRGIEWVSLRRQDNFAIGPAAYLHGISESKHNAMVHAEQFGPRVGKKYVYFGHMHGSQRFVSNAGYTAQCCGFLGNEYDGAFGYKKGRPAPWSLGFLVQDVHGDCVTDTFVSVRDGRATFRGRVY